MTDIRISGLELLSNHPSEENDDWSVDSFAKDSLKGNQLRCYPNRKSRENLVQQLQQQCSSSSSRRNHKATRRRCSTAGIARPACMEMVPRITRRSSIGNNDVTGMNRRRGVQRRNSMENRYASVESIEKGLMQLSSVVATTAAARRNSDTSLEILSTLLRSSAPYEDSYADSSQCMTDFSQSQTSLIFQDQHGIDEGPTLDNRNDDDDDDDDDNMDVSALVRNRRMIMQQYGDFRAKESSKRPSDLSSDSSTLNEDDRGNHLGPVRNRPPQPTTSGSSKREIPTAEELGYGDPPPAEVAVTPDLGYGYEERRPVERGPASGEGLRVVATTTPTKTMTSPTVTTRRPPTTVVALGYENPVNNRSPATESDVADHHSQVSDLDSIISSSVTHSINSNIDNKDKKTTSPPVQSISLGGRSSYYRRHDGERNQPPQPSNNAATTKTAKLGFESETTTNNNNNHNHQSLPQQEEEMQAFIVATTSSTAQEQDAEEQRHRHLDVVAAASTNANFWYMALRWPLATLLGNLTGVFLVFAFMEDVSDNYNPASIARAWLVVGVIAMVDFLLIHKALEQVSKDLASLKEEEEQQQQQEEQQEFWTPIRVHGKVAQLMDKYLFDNGSSTSQERSSSFLINFLYTLGGIALFYSLTCFTVSWLAYGMSQNTDCVGSSSKVFGEEYDWQQQQEEARQVVSPGDLGGEIQGVPAELQTWARNGGDRWNRGLNIVHLKDGKTFAVGRAGSDSIQRLYSIHEDGSFHTHDDVVHPGDIYSLTNSKYEILGFCCEYRPQAMKRSGSDGEDQSLCCYYEGRLHKRKWEHPGETPHGEGLQMRWHDSDHTLWLRQDLVVENKSVGDRRSPSRRSTHTSVARVDMDNDVELTFVANTDAKTFLPFVSVHHLDDSREDLVGCWEDQHFWSFLVALVGSMGVSYWLFRVEGLNSGLVPSTMVIAAFVVNQAQDSLGILLAFFLVEILVVGLLLLTRKRFGRLPSFFSSSNNNKTREVVIWSLYSSFLSTFLVALWDGDEEPATVALILVSLISILLHHPVLQILGGLGLLLVVTTTPVVLIFGRFDLLVSAVFLTVVSTGFMSLGYYSTKYRPYLTFYSHRLWRYAMTKVYQYSSRVVLDPRRGS